jgi:hypothetical protein
MSRNVEYDSAGRRHVVLWKAQGCTPADSHKNSIERNAMRSVELEKKAERHEELYGPLGGAAPAGDTGLPQALRKAEELQKSDPDMSSAEAFRRTMRDPAVAAQYEREFGSVTPLAKDESAGLVKATALARTIEQRDGVSSAEAMRRAMRDPTVAAEYARETGHTEHVERLAKTEKARDLDEAAVGARAAELEREGKPWREAWGQAITEAGYGGGARAAA